MHEIFMIMLEPNFVLHVSLNEHIRYSTLHVRMSQTKIDGHDAFFSEISTIPHQVIRRLPAHARFLQTINRFAPTSFGNVPSAMESFWF